MDLSNLEQYLLCLPVIKKDGKLYKYYNSSIHFISDSFVLTFIGLDGKSYFKLNVNRVDLWNINSIYEFSLFTIFPELELPNEIDEILWGLNDC